MTFSDQPDHLVRTVAINLNTATAANGYVFNRLQSATTQQASM